MELSNKYEQRKKIIVLTEVLESTGGSERMAKVYQVPLHSDLKKGQLREKRNNLSEKIRLGALLNCKTKFPKINL